MVSSDSAKVGLYVGFRSHPVMVYVNRGEVFKSNVFITKILMLLMTDIDFIEIHTMTILARTPAFQSKRFHRPVLKNIEMKRSPRFELSCVVQLFKHFFISCPNELAYVGRAALERGVTYASAQFFTGGLW
jgi:hypothetical protein